MSLFDKHYPKDETNVCAECGKELPVADMTFIEDLGWICNACADASDMVRCSQCGSLFSPDDCSTSPDGAYVCLDCDPDLYWETHDE